MQYVGLITLGFAALFSVCQIAAVFRRRDEASDIEISNDSSMIDNGSFCHWQDARNRANETGIYQKYL